MARTGKYAGPVGVEETRALYGVNPQDEAVPGDEGAARRGTGRREREGRGDKGRLRGKEEARGREGPQGRGEARSKGEARGKRGREKKNPPRDGDNRGLQRLTRVLTGIVCGLILLILGGTLYAVFRDSGGTVSGGSVRGDSGPAGSGSADVSVSGDSSSPYPRSAFIELGRLRIPAGSDSPPGSGADAPPRAVVVLSVVFPYPPEDRPFTEELGGKISLFRQMVRDYFGALSRDELHPLDEPRAKEELLRRFNGELQLGKIELLLFNDLMILE